ncbi:MAG TPA: SRPBCC domain-containing protein, partial [Chloroflexota bacterium]
MTDFTSALDAVQRRVGAHVVDGADSRSVTLSRTFAAPVEDVWDACTNPERIPRWFLPVSGELRLGGRYQLEGNAGGTIERCDPPHGFRATWEFGG